MNKTAFYIVGQHAVMEALKNPERKVLRVFLTEESKKNIHRKNQKKNILQNVKVYFKTKKELDNYTTKDQISHQGYVAEVEELDQPTLKDFVRNKNNITLIFDKKFLVMGNTDLDITNIVIEKLNKALPSLNLE